MHSILLAFFALSVQALNLQKLVPNELIAKDTFDDTKIAEVEADLAGHLVTPDLQPSDFIGPVAHHEKLGQSHFTAKVMYVIGNLVVLGLIAMVYYERGLHTIVSIMALVVSLSLMSNTIKEIYVHDFKYPQFITACHQIATCTVTFTILICRRASTGQKITYPTVATVMTGLGPVAVSFAASLGCSNLALLYTNTHFYEMLTPMNAIVTFSLGVALGRKTSMKLLGPVLCVTATVPLIAFGDLQFSMLGFAFAFSGVFFRATKAQINSMLMSAGAMSQTFDPVELACWMTTLTFGIMVIWSSVEEGLSPYKAIGNVSVIIPLLISCMNAVVLNMSVLFVMKEVGPVAQQVLGELKGALACLGAVAAFGEVISIQQIVAYALSMVAIKWYNQVDTELKAEEMEKKQVENNQSEKA